ncbi:hypothetical protein [Mesorhizobium shangrilense]|uniref:Uncharacterized protein n=1 Tax=Mesorhizobium shangrilense TaxID=460060 RepID=A0ABV2DR16_9HYPH
MPLRNGRTGDLSPTKSKRRREDQELSFLFSGFARKIFSPDLIIVIRLSYFQWVLHGTMTALRRVRQEATARRRRPSRFKRDYSSKGIVIINPAVGRLDRAVGGDGNDAVRRWMA